MTAARSNRAEVRNPVLALLAAQQLLALDTPSRQALYAVLMDLRAQAEDKAAESLRKNKYMIFAYWKCVRVYVGHIAKVVRPSGPPLPSMAADLEWLAESYGELNDSVEFDRCTNPAEHAEMEAENERAQGIIARAKALLS